MKKKNLSKLKAFKDATVYQQKNKNCIYIETHHEYILIDEFKELFRFVGKLIKYNGMTKVIYDQSSLNTFNLPTMEWQYVKWLSDMHNYGLDHYGVVLPNDGTFKGSIEYGRSKLNEEHPYAEYRNINIKYYNSADEALK